MADRGLVCMVKVYGQELNPEEHMSVQEEKQNND